MLISMREISQALPCVHNNQEETQMLLLCWYNVLAGFSGCIICVDTALNTASVLTYNNEYTLSGVIIRLIL